MSHYTSRSRSLKRAARIKQWILRLGLVCLWTFLIFGILYFPKLAMLSQEENKINIFTWGDSIDPAILAEFEHTTGIKVYLNYYSSNEELQFKLLATAGEDCDLIMPSDYTVAQLIKEDLLKPLDRRKLKMWSDINPLLLNHPFDPENRYSIPFVWDVYGLGINTSLLSPRVIPSWNLLFSEPPHLEKIAFINDPIEAVLFAGFHLFHKADHFSEDEFIEIKELLLKQRKWVEAYTDFRGGYFLATGNCPVALVTSAIKRTHKQFPFITFKIPVEGSFITIENFCIPKKSSREKNVYRLLNFLYSKQSIAAHYHSYGLIPSTLSALTDLELNQEQRDLMTLSPQEFASFHFFKNVFSQQKIRNLWVEVKSL